MVVLCFIINSLAPIVNILGLVGFFIAQQTGFNSILIFTIISAVIGIVFGFYAHSYDIAPRWFWSKSANSIFEFRVTAVLGYCLNFAAYPGAIYLVKYIINHINITDIPL